VSFQLTGNDANLAQTFPGKKCHDEGMIGLWFWYTSYGHILFFCFFGGSDETHKNHQNKVSEVGENGPDTYQIANGLNFEHFVLIGDTATE